jgi:hypothetical protein
MIVGEVRGAGAVRHRGGRPKNAAYQDLVMHLAMDWLRATGNAPKPGRSDSTGFGDLVHSLVQWLSLPEGSAAHALRQYWADVKKGKARPKLADFLERHQPGVHIFWLAPFSRPILRSGADMVPTPRP